MDTLFQDLPSSMYGFNFDHHDLDNGSKESPESPVDSSSSGVISSDAHPLDNNPFANEMLKYINEMLMEEDLDEKTCMLQDCLALQAAERSFYQVLSRDYNPTNNSKNGEFNSFYTQTCLVDSLEKTSLAPDLQRQAVKELAEASKSSPGNVDKVFLASPNDPSKPSGSRGRKNYERGDVEDGRINKQSAVSLEDSEHSQSKMFDDVLLCKAENEDFPKLQLNGRIKGSNGGGTTRRKKKIDKKSEVVDLWGLLTQCAQSVAVNDQRTANELLKQISQHSSDSGDGTQRLAYYFANALKTRLAGIGAPSYAHLLSNRTSAADVLKAYEVYILACPFKKMSNLYANKMIMETAERATTLHIVDFGICYGFQWPCLIQRLSARAGGPCKLRITGIEFPQSGFRPEERVEETGRRLKRYCKRFNVPFEYNVIAKKWETIQLQELKIKKDDVVVVNCLYRLKNLPDDTAASTSARDTVLKLIRSINPKLFIHGVANGTYNVPFFITRFREALFHFSAHFDIFEATVGRVDPQRMMFEREVHGRDIMNTIACEGNERVERPETYKQWQARNLRAGFKQVSLNQELVKKVTDMVRSSYHRDFVVDVDGRWMLQGWKGRVINALSCWKPATN